MIASNDRKQTDPKHQPATSGRMNPPATQPAALRARRFDKIVRFSQQPVYHISRVFVPVSMLFFATMLLSLTACKKENVSENLQSASNPAANYDAGMLKAHNHFDRIRPCLDSIKLKPIQHPGW